MSIQKKRSWLLITVGASAILRCARSIRRQMPRDCIGFVGIRTHPNGRLRVVLKSFGQQQYASHVTRALSEALLDSAAQTALSVRNQNNLISVFGECFSSIGLDFVSLVDSNDPKSVIPYKKLMGRIVREDVLRRSASTGLHLQVLMAGKGKELVPELADFLSDNKQDLNILFDHTIMIQSSNIDKFTLSPRSQSAIVGSALATIMQLDPEHPVRVALHPLAIGMSDRLSYWSLGFASTTGKGDEFIDHVFRSYTHLLRNTWSQGHLSMDETRKIAKKLLANLIDSDRTNRELPLLLVKWAMAFFLTPLPPNSQCRSTPADLLACLQATVHEIRIRSQAISADLPNRPPISKPKDPRGWFKRQINRLSRNWLFQWDCQWTPQKDRAAEAATQQARLASLDIPVMNLQLAVQRSLNLSRKNPNHDFPILNQYDPWYNIWLEPIIQKLHPKVLELLSQKALAKYLLSNSNPLELFEKIMLSQLKISPDKNGYELVRAIDQLLQTKGLWLKQVFRMLEDRAAPWWAESLLADSDEYIFAFLPQDDFEKTKKKTDMDSRLVPWDRQAYGVLRLLQGCKPESLLDDDTRNTNPKREWIPIE